MEQLPQRKHPRLKEYDYSQNGIYFVTVCTEKKQCILSRIHVGRGLAPAETRLTTAGEIVQCQLLLLPERYPTIKIETYVIMPNHIHVLLSIGDGAAGASPRPTLMQAMGAYKSLTTRICNQQAGTPGRKLWQTSFYDRVIRDENNFLDAWNYIESNPAKWAEDRYFIP